MKFAQTEKKRHTGERQCRICVHAPGAFPGGHTDRILAPGVETIPEHSDDDDDATTSRLPQEAIARRAQSSAAASSARARGTTTSGEQWSIAPVQANSFRAEQQLQAHTWQLAG